MLTKTDRLKIPFLHNMTQLLSRHPLNQLLNRTGTAENRLCQLLLIVASGPLAAFVVRGGVLNSMIASVLRPTTMRAALIMIYSSQTKIFEQS